MILTADNESPDETARMHRLLWAYACLCMSDVKFSHVVTNSVIFLTLLLQTDLVFHIIKTKNDNTTPLSCRGQIILSKIDESCPLAVPKPEL